MVMAISRMLGLAPHSSLLPMPSYWATDIRADLQSEGHSFVEKALMEECIKDLARPALPKGELDGSALQVLGPSAATSAPSFDYVPKVSFSDTSIWQSTHRALKEEGALRLILTLPGGW